MATKRRKVWVNFYSSGTGFTLPSRTKARETAAPGAVEVAVPMVERLPGDVVRTKIDEVALESAIDRYTEAWETAYATHTDEARRAVTECGRNLRALLRGRR